jgi:hypothetical protein
MSPRQQVPWDQSLFSFGFDVGLSDAALLSRASADSRPMRPQYVVILCLDRILMKSPNCAGSKPRRFSSSFHLTPGGKYSCKLLLLRKDGVDGEQIENPIIVEVAVRDGIRVEIARDGSVDVGGELDSSEARNGKEQDGCRDEWKYSQIKHMRPRQEFAAAIR